MTFGNNIMFSAVVHVTIITAALALAGRGAVMRAPEEYIKVTLVGQAETLRQATGEERQEEPAKVPTQPAKRKTRLQKTAASSPPVAERKESAPDLFPEKKISSQDGGGPSKGDQAGGGVSLQGFQDDGFQRASPGSLQMTVRGRESENAGPGAGEDKTAGSGSRAIGAIRDAIDKAKIYPALAKRRNQEGTVVAEFSINARGLPENVRVTRSSGFSLLDSAARETIVRAAPFPVVSGKIEVLISFVLK